jgi:hypothetical protein
MQVMENETTFLEPLFEKAEAYGKTSYKLFKLEATEKTVDVISTVVSRGTAILTLFTFILFVSIGVSLLLGDILGKTYYGFFCVAGFYGFAACVIYFFMHNWIKKGTGNSIIKQIFSK